MEIHSRSESFTTIGSIETLRVWTTVPVLGIDSSSHIFHRSGDFGKFVQYGVALHLYSAAIQKVETSKAWIRWRHWFHPYATEEEETEIDSHKSDEHRASITNAKPKGTDIDSHTSDGYYCIDITNTNIGRVLTLDLSQMRLSPSVKSYVAYSDIPPSGMRFDHSKFYLYAYAYTAKEPEHPHEAMQLTAMFDTTIFELNDVLSSFSSAQMNTDEFWTKAFLASPKGQVQLSRRKAEDSKKPEVQGIQTELSKSNIPKALPEIKEAASAFGKELKEHAERVRHSYRQHHPSAKEPLSHWLSAKFERHTLATYRKLTSHPGDSSVTSAAKITYTEDTDQLRIRLLNLPEWTDLTSFSFRFQPSFESISVGVFYVQVYMVGWIRISMAKSSPAPRARQLSSIPANTTWSASLYPPTK